MKIAIAGQHINTGASLQEYVNDRTLSVVSRYFENAISTEVHFAKQAHEIVCNIVVHEGAGQHLVIKSDASSDEIYSSFDTALAKCEKQLRKYKSRLKDRHNRVKVSEANLQAIKYVLKPQIVEDAEQEHIPVTIAEKPIEVLTLSVEEALMKMDLENLPALMFKNVKTDRMNVVYYRKDGNISWVDSK